MKNSIIAIIIFLFIGINSNAQVSQLSYQLSFPTGEFNDFISKPSYVGFGWEYRWPLKNEQLTLGGSFTWYYFQDKLGHTTITYEDGGSVTGNINDYSNIYNLLAVLQYDFKKSSGKTVPFIKGGFGGAYQDQRQDAGIWVLQREGFQMNLNAEAGIRLNAGSSNGAVIAVTYNYLPSTDDVPNTSFVGIKLGYSMSKFRF